MSVETASLEMYGQFYDEQNLALAPAIEGMFHFAGLKKFVEESRALLGESNPMLSQAYLLFIYYKKQILDLHTESLNNLAASKLLEKFGVAGIGIDKKTGDADAEITKNIIDAHDNLANNVTESSAELQNSLSRFTIFFSTVQIAIMELVTKHHETQIDQLEAKEKEEKKVETHLSSHSEKNSGIIYDSVTNSNLAQIERRKERKKEQVSILNNLEILTSVVKKMFTPVETGTREMKLMTMAT